ncbi:hypothetical protein [Pseudorhizobium flavum]|jgi:regulator of nucleoside diphosphate kinase|uniref:Regulator of nucleoside diphosphate kinase n=1 Tax=Pseudorhizobium flavum TaxID=1335061 RepID=A0A7X0DC06_9HYPH|nr:hypothetical protein [Pseudorhizobium flavum]MBB6179105.1 regulator of nucleoside diphosphate kinase [Pseudorhizobium flavum]CAD6603399.1 nucleoside-diphosphate kinase [Pseudorhizobium flavum]
MSKDNIILTTKDFTILEAMSDNPRVRPDLLVPHIRRKLYAAIVVFRQDLPEGVASVNSRVTFRVDGGATDTRVLSTGQVEAPVGMFLPITTPRGLALLGLSEGQEAVVDNTDGREERIVLEKVEYQPEAARRERMASKSEPASTQHKPLLRVVSGGMKDVRRPVPVMSDGFDDPGPSAA